MTRMLLAIESSCDETAAAVIDEPTAAAEAMTLLRRTSKVDSPVFLVDADTLPQTLADGSEQTSWCVGAKVCLRSKAACPRQRCPAGRRSSEPAAPALPSAWHLDQLMEPSYEP